MTKVMEPRTGELRGRVAEEVRALMARRRISGVQLSKEIGRSHVYLSRRLNGHTAFDVDDLEAVARIFEVPVSALFGLAAGSDYVKNPT
jgi:transcriptional regulator with XRE-family HTH domain